MSICLAEPHTATAPIEKKLATLSLDRAYEKFFSPLVAYVMSISRCNRQAAEDVVQDLFVHILRKHRSTFEGLASYSAQQAFLYVSARRRAVSWMRHANMPVSRAMSLSLLDSGFDAQEHPQAAGTRAELEHLLAERHETDVASVVIQRELLRDVLTAALGTLSDPIRRQAIALAILEGATPADLRDYFAFAGIKSRDPGIKALVHRAKKRIRAALAENDTTEDTNTDTVRAERENASRDIIHFEHREEASSNTSENESAAATHACLRSA